MAELHRESFDSPWSEQTFITLLSQPIVCGWIARDKEPTGFVLARVAADEIEILTVAIRNSHRRKGIAQTLINQALDWGRKNNGVICHLEVAADNTAALALYESLGFEETGRRDRYYHRPQGAIDAVLMAKQLGDNEVVQA